MIILYILFDGFYNYLNRSPFPSDFENLAFIYEFSPVLVIEILILFLFIPISIAILFYFSNKNEQKIVIYKNVMVRLTVCLCLFFILNSKVFNVAHEKLFNYIVWTPELTIRLNGRFSSFLYYAHQEKKNRKKLLEIHSSSMYKNNHYYESLYPNKVKRKKNITMIVLESFIDPRLINELKFDNHLLANELRPYLNSNGDFSHIISPIYGGGTAQAEFEVLTGIKALSRVNQIEFNVMKGLPMSSFVRHLNNNDYQTIATIAPDSVFFNSKLAYQSLGFQQIEFLQNVTRFSLEYQKSPIFDGDLLNYNFEKMKQLYNKDERPIFNYILGMYGHLPFKRDQSKRPDVTHSQHSDDRLRRISNQFHYRTKALGLYIKQMINLDENAIIYITSDHLPSILGKNTNYKLNNKINIALLIHQGKTIDVSGKNLYELPWLIWDLMTEVIETRELSEKQMELLYFNALSESVVPTKR